MTKPTANRKAKLRAPSSAVDRTIASITDVTVALYAEYLASGAESGNAFAARADISPQGLSEAVNRQKIGRKPTLDFLLAIAAAFGCGLADMESASRLWRRGVRPASKCFGRSPFPLIVRTPKAAPSATAAS